MTCTYLPIHTADRAVSGTEMPEDAADAFVPADRSLASFWFRFVEKNMVKLENTVPNSCDVVRVTNNDSRSGNRGNV